MKPLLPIDKMYSDLPAVTRRFLRYVQIDTQSDAASTAIPSTAKQKNLSQLLVDELHEMGYPDAKMDSFGYVFCTVKAIPEEGKTGPSTILGLLAHLDTAPDESGEGVRPVVHPPYNGDVISLPGDPSVKLDPARSPALLNHLNERIISSDGTTLLGSDDKAGVAILMQLAEDLISDAAIRPEIHLCFTIDEEIGRGVDHLDIEAYSADVAYTLDGSSIDTISFETFNASAVSLHVEGRSVHPGYAKGVLVNAVRILVEILAALPAEQAPETTEDRKGYLHPHRIENSDVAHANALIILRDFTRNGMDEKKDLVRRLVEAARTNHPEAKIEIELTDQYQNMRSYIEDIDFRTVTFARESAREMGIDLMEELVRGGTDGSRLSERGLPTPNLSNGGYDYHSRFEWNTVESLDHSLACTKALVGYWGRHADDV